MDITTVLGLVIGIGGILLGNILEGGHIGSLVQGAAAVIVISGTFGAVLVSSKKKDFKLGFTLFKKAFAKPDQEKGQKILGEILDCARIARKESILSLEPKINQMGDPFMQNILRAVVDGVDAQVIRSMFETEISIEEERLNAGAKVWLDAGGFSPTIGIIGAVLGLIHVMGNLSDMSKLGSGIAVAFVATVYGVGLANLVFLPIGNKLKKKVAEEIRFKEMILEGALAIHSGLSPTMTDIKMKSYLEKP